MLSQSICNRPALAMAIVPDLISSNSLQTRPNLFFAGQYSPETNRVSRRVAAFD
jgi:hypothetical protein